MRNISTTFSERYQTEDGNVTIERFKRGLWSVMPRGQEPFLVKSRLVAETRARAIASGMSRDTRERWTVTAGRVLCFDGREIATLQRVTEPNSEIGPSDLDDLVHEIAGHLNVSERVVKHPPHARFCQRCGKRAVNPAIACVDCGHAIMGPAFKSAWGAK